MKRKRKQRREKPPLKITAAPTPEKPPLQVQLAAVLARVELRRGITVTESPPEETIRDKRVRWWKTICPAIMRETETSRLPCSPKQIAAVMSYPIAAYNLRIIGDTGAGKTRLAWQLLEVEYLAGTTLLAMDFGEFAAQASGAYRDGAERQFFFRLERPDILFIDDVGKSRMTQRVAEALFTIVDRRINHRKSLLFTMNYTLETFGVKLQRDEIDPETVAALIRRMREQIPKIALCAQ